MSTDVVPVVEYGSVVRFLEGEEEKEVVVDDGVPSFFRVAPDSVLGQALMGRAPGDAVTVELGRGLPSRCITILSV